VPLEDFGELKDELIDDEKMKEMYAKYLKQFNSDVQFTQRTSLLDINNEVSKSQDEPRLFSFAQPAQSQQPLANQIAQKFKEYEDPRYTKYFREDSEYSDF